VSGNPPRVTLTPDQPSYTDGDPIRVAVSVSDADTTSETIHGADSLGRVVEETIGRTDTAVITAATWAGSGEPLHIDGLTLTGTARYGAGPVNVVVRDGQGNETTASLTVDVRALMLVGSDRSPIDMAVYPTLAYTRLYSPAGKGIKSLTGLPAGVVAHVSFKDQPTATLVNPWLNTVTRPVILEWHHEPEGDMTIAAYRAGVTALLQLVRAHANGRLVRVAQTFTGYAQRHGKTGPDGLAAAWKAMWCGADLIGFDCEVDRVLAATGYPDPKAFFAVAVAASTAAGVPFLVPELGWPQDAKDTDGTLLAAWYTACIAYLRTVNCAGAAAYDTPQPPAATGNYLLVGKPLAAMQRAVAGH
jgi:hypothetical protein